MELGYDAVQARLAACAQVAGPVASTFWWEDGIERAARILTEADFAAAQIQARRVDAQIAAEVSLAWAQLATARAQVERMTGGELDAATRQRDILQKKLCGEPGRATPFGLCSRTCCCSSWGSRFVCRYHNTNSGGPDTVCAGLVACSFRRLFQCAKWAVEF
jgi:hypothetical protein